MLQLGERYLETRTARQNYAPLDKVLQLPNVSRPVIARQRSHRLLRNALDSSLHLLSELLCEEMNQHGYIFRPLAQRRYIYRKNIQTIIKIVPKFLFSHIFGETAISSSMYANPHP